MDPVDQRIRLRLSHVPTGPVAKCLGAVEKGLTREGYARASIHGKLRLVADFSVWLKKKNIQLALLTHDHVRDYLRYRSHRRRARRHDRAALRQLLQFLEQMHAIRVQCPRPTAAERWLDAFATYLAQDRGLSRRTIESYVFSAKPFLNARLKTQSMKLDAIKAADAVDYVRREAARLHSPRSAQRVATSLRSFLRYAR